MQPAAPASFANPVVVADLNRKLFRKLDTNHDGLVSREEMKRAGLLRDLGAARTDDEEAKVFDSIDTDKSGSLSQGESAQYFGKLMGSDPKAMITISALTQQMADDPDSPDALGARANQERQPAPARLDPDSAEAKRLKAKQDRLSPSYNADLAKYALTRAAAHPKAADETTPGVSILV